MAIKPLKPLKKPEKIRKGFYLKKTTVATIQAEAKRLNCTDATFLDRLIEEYSDHLESEAS